jgi:hypothetical protein
VEAISKQLCEPLLCNGVVGTKYGYFSDFGTFEFPDTTYMCENSVTLQDKPLRSNRKPTPPHRGGLLIRKHFMKPRMFAAEIKGALQAVDKAGNGRDKK